MSNPVLRKAAVSSPVLKKAVVSDNKEVKHKMISDKMSVKNMKTMDSEEK